MILRGANSRSAITPLGHLRRAKNRAPSIFICEALTHGYIAFLLLYSIPTSCAVYVEGQFVQPQLSSALNVLCQEASG